ncbi:MAG: energy transducer TonB [Acidobacteriia bacterium]|nr:energy transducer TonB [Terriglobia bacterium]
MNRTAEIALERRVFFAFVALLTGAGPGGRWAIAQSVAEKPNLLVLKKKEATRFILKQPTPEYPALARMNYIQGNVRVLVTVGEDGNVSEVHVVTGHPFLALAALKAVSNWVYEPAGQRRGPREFMTFVDVRFSLQFKQTEQMPRTPERDLKRQIHPPKLLEKPADSSHAIHVPLRVLVGPEGDAVDSLPLEAGSPLLAKARRIVDGWRFQPARWGTLPVPWYLDVDVPVESWPAAQTAADTAGR